MRRLSKMRNVILACALVATTAACDATSGRETVGEYVDDSTITARVKSFFLNEPDMKSMQIDVTTFQNVVQLSGFVDKSTTKVRAGEIARGTKGVKDVKNDLIVR
ncbi:MAG: BON domain-containing protein [Rhodospirillales bacterium]